MIAFSTVLMGRLTPNEEGKGGCFKVLNFLTTTTKLKKYLLKINIK